MKNYEHNKSGLNIIEGVNQPASINKTAVKKFQDKKRKEYTVKDYINGILQGDRIILSQAITLIESFLPEHQKLAQEIIEKCLPYTGNSIRIGITGIPGVGKSTFIEVLGKYITKQDRRLAVLAIDPSSERSKGSILGDKTRMEELSNDPSAYIRPSPSAGSVGGVARKTRETIILCEAAGFDTIFIETIGVGQSETAVHSMTDFFLLLMLAGAGDELQGIKRGIMEMADAVAITKDDGENVKKVAIAKNEYLNALHLYPPAESGWTPKVLTCSSLKSNGIALIWNTILKYYEFTKTNNYFYNKRREQAKYWMYETINQSLKDHFFNNKITKKKLTAFEQNVLEGKVSSFIAAKKLLKEYFGDK